MMNPVFGPPKALHEIDQIIGNEETISAEDLGKVRGIVLDSLNAWHEVYGEDAGCHTVAVIDPRDQVKL